MRMCRGEPAGSDVDLSQSSLSARAETRQERVPRTVRDSAQSTVQPPSEYCLYLLTITGVYTLLAARIVFEKRRDKILPRLATTELSRNSMIGLKWYWRYATR